MSDIPYGIRLATPLDFPAINLLCVEAYRDFESAIGPARWQEMKETLSHASDLSRYGDLIVAEDGQGLLGVVVYVPPGRSDGTIIPSQWATIRMLAVSPSHRGKGIGKKLTEKCIERARRDRAERIGLTTGEMMTVALPMYERMGFEKDAELGKRFGVPHTRYVLKLG
jgi:ribosomal protein S18 acetylase RimI-like enzyme